MKKLLFLLFAVAISHMAIAQKTMTEGIIVLELTDIKSDDPAMQGMLSSMKGGTIETVFTKDKQRSSTSMMGGMVKTMSYTDVKSKSANTYMDMMGNKIALKIDPKEVEENEPDFDIEKTGETKMINGYKTTKYVMKLKDKEVAGGEFVLYVAEDIKINSIDLGNNITTTQISGAPLEMSMSMQGMSMAYTLKKLENKIPEDAFVEPTGYKEMTMEEFQKSMGGMGF